MDFFYLCGANSQEFHQMFSDLSIHPDTADDEGTTLLMGFAAYASAARVRLMLSRGANPNAKDKEGQTALHYLALHKWMADDGNQDTKSMNSMEAAQNELILQALKTIRLLVKAGGDVNSRDEAGETPLMLFAWQGSLRCVQLLLALGADKEATDNIGNTVLHHALRTGTHSRSFFGGKFVVPNFLLDSGANIEAANTVGDTPLIAAVHEGSQARMALLVKRGARCVPTPAYSHWSVLLGSLQGASPELVKLVQAAPPEVIDACSEESKRTALSFAAERGDVEMCELLLNAGANPNYADAAGWTPFVYACAHAPEAVVQLLLDFGADVNTRAFDSPDDLEESRNGEGRRAAGRNALNWAVSFGNLACVPLLLEQGVSPVWDEGGPSVSEAAHVQCPQVLWAKRAIGDTNGMRLSPAVYAGDERLIRTLIAEGADLDGRDDDGYVESRFPLFAAADRGNIALAQLLIDFGADVNNFSNYEGTALMAAAAKGNLEMVRFLLNAGANPALINRSGETAADVATKSGFYDVARALTA